MDTNVAENSIPEDQSSGAAQTTKKKTRRGNKTNKKIKSADSDVFNSEMSNLKITESHTDSSSVNPENSATSNNVCQAGGADKNVQKSLQSLSSKVSEKKGRKKVASGPKETSASNSAEKNHVGSENEISAAKKSKSKKKKSNSSETIPPKNDNQRPIKELQVSRVKVTGSHFNSQRPLSELENELRKGEIIKGQIRVSQKNYKNSYISDPEDHRPDILISELANRNGAFDSDIVAVRLNPETKWVVQHDQIREHAELDPEFCKCLEDVLRTENNDSTNDFEIQEIVKYENEVEVSRTKPQQSGNDDEIVPIKLVKKLPNWERFVQRTGVVVGIFEKVHNRKAVGYLNKFPDSNPNFALFRPKDSRIPRIRIPADKCPKDFWLRPESYANLIFVAQVTRWEVVNYAVGELIDCLGEDSDLSAQTRAILMASDVDDSPFSSEAISSLPTLPFTISKDEICLRKDYRQSCVFTVDPATARDLDDALSVDQLHNGNFLVGVHIADVSHFVRESSELDNVASKRGTTVYLVEKCIPMLPRELSEDLCSLNPGTDRLTFSVEWEITKSGQIISVWFGKSIIRSCTKLSYEDAQDFIDKNEFDPSDYPVIQSPWTITDITSKLKILNELATNIRKGRYDKGLLRIDRPKICFKMNKESGLPDGFFIFKQLDSHRLIEEFMILANVSVAKKIYQTFPNLALLRRHPPPDQNQMKKKEGWLRANGFQVNLSTKKEFQASLERCTNPKFSSENGEAGKSCLKPKATSSALETKNIVDLKNTMKKVDEIEFLEEIQKVSLPKEVTKSQSRNEKVDEETSIGVLEAAILEKLTTHKHTVPKDPVADPQLVKRMKVLVAISALSMPMKLAEYICTDGQEKEFLAHYALAEDLYTHFTSPIRRYPDVIVHRLLLAAISSNEPKLTSENVSKICKHCNIKKLNAKKSSEKSEELFLARFIANTESYEDVAIVTQVLNNHVSCLLGNLGVERKVHFNRMKEIEEIHLRKNKRKCLELTWKKEAGLENVSLEVFDVLHVILKPRSPTDFEVHFDPSKKVVKNKKSSQH